MADARQIRISKENFIIKDDSFWGQLVEPNPTHIIVMENAIELVVSPWENVDKTDIQLLKG